jgi:stage III sporulation protein AE
MRFLLFLIALILSGSTMEVQAKDVDSTTIGSEEDTYTSIDDFNFEDIQNTIDEILTSNSDFDFKEYVIKLVSGGNGLSTKGLLSDILGAVKQEFDGNKAILFKLIMIAVVAAIFTNFANVFKNNQIADTSFYITYLLLFTTITGTFITATSIAGDTVEAILAFMKALIPTYFTSIAFCSGQATTLVFYEATLVLITVVDLVLVHIMIPLVNIYMIITLANNLAKEDLLSKLAELLETIIKWSLRTLFIAVIGVNTIQGLIVPAANGMKKTATVKLTSLIPGVGNTFKSVAEAVLGAGSIIKNAIGVAGLIVIIIICVIPLLKLLITMFIYKLGVAIVQPISDKRIVDSISGAGNAAGLLFYIVCMGAVLFMITIAILAASTNVKV